MTAASCFLFEDAVPLAPMNPESEPTLLQFIVFSDLVIREQGSGKSSLIGTFDLFNVPSFPFQAPPFFVTIGITNVHLTRAVGEPPKEVNVNVRVEDKRSGHVYGNSTGKVSVNEGKTLNRDQTIMITLPMPPITFMQPGPVTVVVHVDNERVGDRTLTINPLSAPTNP
jgi:hypothetical protein